MTTFRQLLDEFDASATSTGSGLVNDANKWGLEHGNPRYIIDLIKKVVTVSVRTVEIVDNLLT